MDLNLLKRYVAKHFNESIINDSYGKPSSVPDMVKDYLNKNPNYTYQMPDEKKILIFHHNKFIGGINGQTSMSNKPNGTRIARDKILTEKHLKRFGINTTNSVAFKINEFETAKSYVENIDSPFVVKPYNLSSGKGITLDVTKNTFIAAWEKAINQYSTHLEQAQILIQPQLPGIEARFLIIEGVFNSVILRVPSNVIGDGIHSIKELIAEKNSLRFRNAHLQKFPINLTDEILKGLSREGLNENSVLEKDRIVFLTKISNVALGGDTIEISHLISDETKMIAESAVKAIPDLKSAGVDIMFDPSDERNAAVLEVNHAGNLIMHHYPWKGTPKRPIFDLIDYFIDKHQNEYKDIKKYGIFKRFISIFRN